MILVKVSTKEPYRLKILLLHLNFHIYLNMNDRIYVDVSIIMFIFLMTYRDIRRRKKTLKSVLASVTSPINPHVN